jgi:3'-phosphoadenosine 5'-phosphosulfate sulfotransferase (PAPS reductase)/FAD synthetase
MLIDFLPIHDWTTKQVWEVIIQNKIPYHYAYDLGMPRLSCVFCIFAPFAALVLAGIHNPELLDEYVAVEKEINHTFKDKMSLQTVKDAIAMGFAPDVIPNWSM